MNISTKFTKKMNEWFGDKHPISLVLFGYGVVLLLCVPVLYLMDFADMVPLALTMGPFALFFAFFPFTGNKEQECADPINKAPKAGRKKKILLIMATIFIVLLAWVIYDDKTVGEVNCLKRVEYRGTASSGYYGIFEDGSWRKFKTQSEGMNYCLKVL
ncbi:MAG: hypothetical protein WC791_00540 [Candidatus Paceibacterota bacterium]|jgi:hypothetical protein